jgi:hypothetical protein
MTYVRLSLPTSITLGLSQPTGANFIHVRLISGLPYLSWAQLNYLKPTLVTCLAILIDEIDYLS